MVPPSNWSVTLRAFTEEVQAPHEPAKLRLARRSSGKDEKSGSSTENERKQRPLCWKVIHSVEIEPTAHRMQADGARVQAIARDGMNLDKRSSGSAGASLSLDDRALVLYAQTLRDCMYHAASGEAIGTLNVALRPGEELVVNCETFWTIDADRPTLDQAESDAASTPPNDRAAGLLIIEVHPRWRNAILIGKQQADVANPVTVRINGVDTDAARSPSFNVVVRGKAISTNKLTSPLSVVIRNNGLKSSNGYVSFRVASFNDADRHHAIFRSSLPFRVQDDIWRRWASEWIPAGNQNQQNSPEYVQANIPISRDTSIGAVLTCRRNKN